jgi:hypothetical protein
MKNWTDKANNVSAALMKKVSAIRGLQTIQEIRTLLYNE